MKKIATIGGVLVILIVFISVAINWFFNLPCPPPAKLKSIPVSAQWHGGCDGGYWFDLLNVDRHRRIFRFRIYNDFSGQLELDADFMLKKPCSNEMDEILSDISYYNDGIIYTNKDCRLIMIAPAYGGDTWNTLKEKAANVSN